MMKIMMNIITMMEIELHSYIGAFRLTDKLRPGFRTRAGTLLVLTHAKPKNKPFYLIPAKNISSDHFTCKTEYVYMCVADNQSAKRYNNVPGGKISFFSHLIFTNTMKFLIGITPTFSASDFSLTEHATVTPEQIVEAVLAPERTKEQQDLVDAITARANDNSLRMIQERQIEEKLSSMGIEGKPSFPENQESMDAIVEFLSGQDADAIELAIGEMKLSMPADVLVDPAEVVEALKGIAEGSISATTEVEKVEELQEMPLPVNVAPDSLQVSAVPATGELVIPAQTLANTLQQVGDISKAANDLVNKANDLKDNLLKTTVAALQAMAVDPRETSVDAEVVETTQL